MGENVDFDKPRHPEFNHRSGDILLPQIKFIEPLRTRAEHYLDCIRGQRVPRGGVEHAWNVVSILARRLR